MKELNNYIEDYYGRVPDDKDLTLAAEYFFNAGKECQKEEFEQNRLAACDNLTKEEYDREVDFATNIIEKENRKPTFSDAIEYGMRLRKEQIIKAFFEKCKQEEIDPAIAKVIEDHWWEML